MRPAHRATIWLLATLAWLFSHQASALLGAPQDSSSSSLLAVDDDYVPTLEEAFDISALADAEGQQITVTFVLYPGVYLYQHRFDFRLLDQNGNLLNEFADYQPPAGKHKVDEIFGDVQVYYDRLDLVLPLDAVPMVDTVLEVDYQGCLEEILCYPPKTASLPLQFNTASNPPRAAGIQSGSDDDFFATLASEDAGAFSRWMGGHGLGMTVLLFFVGGVLLAFTPCVFPMIPILSGIIAGSANPSAGRGFILSSAYVLGVAVPYTLAGLLVALFGAGLNLQYLLQQPAAIITSVVIFVVLSLSMFGLYELQLPEKLRNRLNALGEGREGGSLWGAGIMGAISALVVSPCVTPILAGALVYVAGSGDALTGAASLFALSIGMGVPLIMVGTGGGHALPRAGAWMDEIKRFFGVLMLGVAVWLAGRIMDDALTLGLYGILMAAYGVYLGALEPVGEDGSRLKRAIALVMALYGAIMVVGGAGGGTDPLRPLTNNPVAAATHEQDTSQAWQGQLQTGQWLTLRGEQALDQALAASRAAGKPVLVDFFADWCVACKVLEEETLTHPDVLTQLDQHVLLRVDITEVNRANQQIMERFNILGLPCLIFFAGDGQEVADSRVLGEMGPQTFLSHLAQRVAAG